MNIQEKRQLLEMAMEKNKLCSVVFVKANGEERAANICRFAEKGFASGDKNVVQQNTTDHKPEIFTAWDIQNNKWVKFNLEKLISMRFKGVHVDFKT